MITHKEIKRIIIKYLDERGVKVKRVILFGSMARGDYKKFSDYDILITVANDLTDEEKKEIWYTIYKIKIDTKKGRMFSLSVNKG